MVQISEIGEIVMLLCFGFSWPVNAVKAYRARTAKSTSLPFLLLILSGYVGGVISKLTNPNGFKWYVMFFYILNFCFVSLSVVIYFRNRHLDAQAASSK